MDHHTPSDDPRRNAESSATSTTLLESVREGHPAAWDRLVELYGPVIYGWCRRTALSADDAGDLVQEVFRAVFEHLDGFRRNRPGDSFRAWLFAITRNKIRDLRRRGRGRPVGQGGTAAQQRLLGVAVPPEAEPGDAEYGSALSHRALELVRAQFEARTWQAFWGVAVDGRPGADVAAELGMSVAAVYQAKYRVAERLRREFGELLV